MSEANSDLRQVPDIERIVNGKRYRSLDAVVVAQGLSPLVGYSWLLQTQRQNWFIVAECNEFVQSLVGSPHVLRSLTPEEAKIQYEGLAHQVVGSDVAFGDHVEDA